MFGFLTQMVGGALAPLIDQISDFGTRLLRKLALFIVAGLCLVVVVLALTLAFGLWIAALAGPIVGVLSVAALYLLIAIGAVALAMATPKGDRVSSDKPESENTTTDRADLESQIDDFTAPLMGLLQSLGLRREQLAVFAGASVAKRLGPVPLVGLAIVAGFLIGRTYKRWQGLVSLDTLTGLLASAGLFGFGPKAGQEDDNMSDETDKKKAA